MRRLITYRRDLSVVLITIFAMWQVNALLHFTMVTHEICEHGQVVDTHQQGHKQHRDHEDHDHRGSNHHGDEGHDDCQTVVHLTGHGTNVGPSLDLAPVLLQQKETISVPTSTRVFIREALYLFAPSNSPPFTV